MILLPFATTYVNPEIAVADVGAANELIYRYDYPNYGVTE